MSERTKKLGEMLGGKFVAELPETGGGVTGAAHLGHIVMQIQNQRLNIRRDVAHRLSLAAERATTQGKPTTPEQLAFRLLDEALTKIEREQTLPNAAS